MLCAIPGIRALRSTWPEAELTLIGLPWARALIERYTDCFDSFQHLPGFPGFPEQEFNEEALDAFFRDAAARRFDLAVQMQGNGTFANDLIVRLGAPRTAGFYPRGTPSPDPESYRGVSVSPLAYTWRRGTARSS
jgi:hypothetical protein